MSESLLLEAHLEQLRVAVHKVPHDEVHLYDEFPIGVLFLAGLLLVRAVLVPALVDLAVLLDPGHSPGKFFFVVYALVHPAEDFGLIDLLVAHSEVLLEEVRVDDGACDAHCYGAEAQVALAAHGRYRLSGACPAEYLLGNVCRYAVIGKILDVVSVDSVCRKSLLSVCGEHCCKINCSRTLGSVESPYCLWIVRVHIHSFRTVTPARSYGNSGTYSLPFELFRTGGGFGNTANGAVGYDALYRRAVSVVKVGTDEVSNRLGKSHRLVLQAFADTALASVNGRPDTDFWVL